MPSVSPSLTVERQAVDRPHVGARPAEQPRADREVLHQPFDGEQRPRRRWRAFHVPFQNFVRSQHVRAVPRVCDFIAEHSRTPAPSPATDFGNACPLFEQRSGRATQPRKPRVNTSPDVTSCVRRRGSRSLGNARGAGRPEVHGGYSAIGNRVARATPRQDFWPTRSIPPDYARTTGSTSLVRRASAARHASPAVPADLRPPRHLGTPPVDGPSSCRSRRSMPRVRKAWISSIASGAN